MKLLIIIVKNYKFKYLQKEDEYINYRIVIEWNVRQK